MGKLILRTLSIEITRKCNMQCAHCMRGDAQNLDIYHSDIRNVLKHIAYIGHFNITGGEPSLNIKAIRYILKQVRRFGIEVYEFYIVTNGSNSSLSDNFIDVCSKLYDYQQKKDMSGNFRMLEMSDDRFHDDRFHAEIIQGKRIKITISNKEVSLLLWTKISLIIFRASMILVWRVGVIICYRIFC